MYPLRIMLTGIHAFDERLMAAMTNAERIEILSQCVSYLKDSPGHELKLEKLNRFIADISDSSDTPADAPEHRYMAMGSGSDYVSSDSLNRYIANVSGSEYISSASLAALQQA